MKLTIFIVLFIALPIILSIIIDTMQEEDNQNSITGEESKNIYENTEHKNSKTNIPKDE